MKMRHLIIWVALATGACSTSVPPSVHSGPVAAASGCATPAVRIDFDFEGAPLSRCVINGEREFTLLVAPEHAPPINPSPWYAFRYEAGQGAPVTVHLDYLVGDHRYAPKWSDGSIARQLEVELSQDGKRASFVLPAGSARVSAQEVLDTQWHGRAMGRWESEGGERIVLGRSHDGRPIEALTLGSAEAERLVVLLGRQHPPEVSGAVAMEAFVDRIVERLAEDTGLAERYRFLVVPLLNPDGVARGHWRANRGGRDLNRDWGIFSQPETAAVKTWLDANAIAQRPVVMIDFHSTRSNLFYVQGEEETDAREQAFLDSWLGQLAGKLEGFEFTIERRNANPGSGTSKNWFHETFDIPAYTYEVGDESDRSATKSAARRIADRFVETLPIAADSPKD